jgi:hypothetical protein
VLIDQSESNIAIARRFLSGEVPWERTWERRHPCLPGRSDATEQESRQGCLRSLEDTTEFITERFEPGTPCDFDLLVIPLAFEGDREAIYQHPSASAVIVHDWIWRLRGASSVVSWLLLKRLNLVIR